MLYYILITFSHLPRHKQPILGHRHLTSSRPFPPASSFYLCLSSSLLCVSCLHSIWSLANGIAAIGWCVPSRSSSLKMGASWIGIRGRHDLFSGPGAPFPPSGTGITSIVGSNNRDRAHTGVCLSSMILRWLMCEAGYAVRGSDLLSTALPYAILNFVDPTAFFGVLLDLCGLSPFPAHIMPTHL